MRSPIGTEVVKLQVDISESLKMNLKLTAVRQNRTMSEMVEEAIAEYLQKIKED